MFDDDFDDPFIAVHQRIADVSQAIEQLDKNRELEVTATEKRHQEVMEYLMHVKMNNEKQAENIKLLLYMILALLCFIAIKLS